MSAMQIGSTSERSVCYLVIITATKAWYLCLSGELAGSKGESLRHNPGLHNRPTPQATLSPVGASDSSNRGLYAGVGGRLHSILSRLIGRPDTQPLDAVALGPRVGLDRNVGMRSGWWIKSCLAEDISSVNPH
jgi:hypothetical protein